MNEQITGESDGVRKALFAILIILVVSFISIIDNSSDFLSIIFVLRTHFMLNGPETCVRVINGSFRVKWVINVFVFVPTRSGPFNNRVRVSCRAARLLIVSCSCLGSWPVY